MKIWCDFCGKGLHERHEFDIYQDINQLLQTTIAPYIFPQLKYFKSMFKEYCYFRIDFAEKDIKTLLYLTNKYENGKFVSVHLFNCWFNFCLFILLC